MVNEGLHKGHIECTLHALFQNTLEKKYKKSKKLGATIAATYH